MTEKMFCFQCEQTAGCSACKGKAGVCGKTADVANLQDELTGALIDLARIVRITGANPDIDRLTMEALFTTVTNVNFNEDTIRQMTQRVMNAKKHLKTSYNNQSSYADQIINDSMDKAYSLELLWNEQEDIRSLKSLILFGLRGMAAYAYHALMLGYSNQKVNNFFYEGLSAIAEDMDMAQLLPLVLKVGEVNLKCMEMLDEANTSAYGMPAPVTVPLKVEKGPFIVITGHDLKDLKLLLEQTKNKSINIYTNGEMLPAHAYPELNAYPHLKGNFGTAWHNQQKEFANIPAPVLYTTNCLMPPKPSYADRIFTTEVVSYPGIRHIGEDKDFTPVIEKALELGGYTEDQNFTGINGGHQVTTGFGHHAVLSVAETVVEAINAGALKHIFLVGGCDGMRSSRSYFTEFVKQTPSDTAVLTLACGKYRFNDLDLGTIGGLPRIMDMGQCNDAYSAIKVAVALADVFKCGVNDLPLTLVLSWYEQKAVCILLTLLHLGIKNIYLGPSLPAFLSPNVANFLVENYNIHPVSTPDEDLKSILEK